MTSRRQQPISGIRSGRTCLRLFLALALLGALTASGQADHIAGLNITVDDIGQIRLHVGTADFTATGNQGIGKATPAGEQSGFYVKAGNLATTAAGVNEHHFNWLQIVKVQPPGHNATFGAVPHADPSDAPANPTPRDNQPWYLNESGAGGPPAPPINPPFDLPPGTDTLLPYQDFPSGFNLGDMIAFDTYLVSIVDQTAKTYSVHAGFTWKITRELDPGVNVVRNHVVELREISPVLPQAYQDIAANYQNMGWRLVPEPPTFILAGLGASGLMGWRFLRRNRAA
ncbi:MAG TPA: PEP-CTERM sorting domain-containing protein [Gemmataceae bacterium]|nr:PEP-CTERM sorting domain-containing protein [Gemmataceae bacterium]